MRRSLILALFLFSSIATAAAPKDRVEKAIRAIIENTNGRFSPLYKAVVIETAEENNAWSIANFIVVTRSTLDLLNDAELTAVVAHEMAHRERGHIYKRANTIVAVPILLAVRKLRLFVSGRRSIESDIAFLDFLSGFNEDYQLRQEMQADCHAYNWLQQLKAGGLPADPLDLNRARNKMMGIDFDAASPEFFADLPPYIRHRQVILGYGAACD